MRVVEQFGQTVISLEEDEVTELCKPGHGADTCIWVLVAPYGFECFYYSRPTALMERWVRRQMVAERDGCRRVKELGYKIKYVEAKTLEDAIKEMKRRQ